MSRTVKIIIAVVVAIVAFNLLVIIAAHVQAAEPSVIPGPDGFSQPWCSGHHLHCKRSVESGFYHHLKINGRRAPASGSFAPTSAFGATASTSDCPNRHHYEFHKQFGGLWDNNNYPKTLFPEWVQHLNVTFCHSGGEITYHYSRSWIDMKFWTAQFGGNERVSEWYPWGGSFAHHNGRFEGIDTTMHECVFFLSLSCIVEDHPFLHTHLHGDGTFSYSSSTN